MNGNFQFFLFVVLITGCSSLTPDGTRVLITTNVEAAKGCTVLGKVVAGPPYALPGDWQIKLRNAAGKLGGNLVVAENPGFRTTVDGVAYSCPEGLPSLRR